MSEHMQEKVDNAIEESESLEHFGTLRLDALSQKKDQDRLNMNQRPKFSYENFDGTYSNFGTFIKNAEQIFSFFFRPAQTATCAVVKNHQPRNIKDPDEIFKLQKLQREIFGLASFTMGKSPPSVASCV